MRCLYLFCIGHSGHRFNSSRLNKHSNECTKITQIDDIQQCNTSIHSFSLLIVLHFLFFFLHFISQNYCYKEYLDICVLYFYHSICYSNLIKFIDGNSFKFQKEISTHGKNDNTREQKTQMLTKRKVLFMSMPIYHTMYLEEEEKKIKFFSKIILSNYLVLYILHTK